MGSVAIQLLTLLGVLLGAVASFVSSRYAERERWRREQSSRWDIKKLEAYAAFADAVKEFTQLAHRLAAGRGLGTGTPISLEEGIELLAVAEAQVGVRWESVLLLGDPATAAAGSDWRHAAWHIEWFARGLRDDPDEFSAAAVEGGRARKAFYQRARQDLGITSGPLPQLSWPPVWQQDQSIPAA